MAILAHIIAMLFLGMSHHLADENRRDWEGVNLPSKLNALRWLTLNFVRTVL